jgi:hypothetical protein
MKFLMTTIDEFAQLWEFEVTRFEGCGRIVIGEWRGETKSDGRKLRV